MRRIKPPLLLAIALLGAGAPARSEIFESTQTGNGLLILCRSGELSQEMTACYSYLKGVLDGWLTADNTYSHKAAICVPKGVNLIQIRDILVRWLEQNPHRRHEEGSVSLINALASAFPCNR